MRLFMILLLMYTNVAFAGKHCWCEHRTGGPNWSCNSLPSGGPILLKYYGAIHFYPIGSTGEAQDCRNRCMNLITSEFDSANYVDQTPGLCNKLRNSNVVPHPTLSQMAQYVSTTCASSWVGTSSRSNVPTNPSAICNLNCPKIAGFHNVKNAGNFPLLSSSRRIYPTQFSYYDETFYEFNAFTYPNASSCGALLQQYECVYQQPVQGGTDLCFGLNRGQQQFQGGGYANTCSTGQHKEGGIVAFNIYKRVHQAGQIENFNLTFDSCSLSISNPHGRLSKASPSKIKIPSLVKVATKSGVKSKGRAPASSETIEEYFEVAK